MRALAILLGTLPGVALAQDMDGDGYDASVDCDDTDPFIFPGMVEFCDDGIDQDCDGADQSCDLDGDGYVDDDCDNNDPTRHPGALEICDDIDNDCDGRTDESEAPENGGGVTYYGDVDGDGYGDILRPGLFCPPVSRGYSENADDCDDMDENIHPGAEDVCDGADNDCDDEIDEDCDDLDGDGAGLDDCDDDDPAVHPGATEACNGYDDNCDGTIDEGCPGATPPTDDSGQPSDDEGARRGCGGGRSFALLLPLMLLGRRRDRS